MRWHGSGSESSKPPEISTPIAGRTHTPNAGSRTGFRVIRAKPLEQLRTLYFIFRRDAVRLRPHSSGGVVMRSRAIGLGGGGRRRRRGVEVESARGSRAWEWRREVTRPSQCCGFVDQRQSQAIRRLVLRQHPVATACCWGSKKKIAGPAVQWSARPRLSRAALDANGEAHRATRWTPPHAWPGRGWSRAKMIARTFLAACRRSIRPNVFGLNCLIGRS